MSVLRLPGSKLTGKTRSAATSGSWYPWIFVACMVLVVVVNGILVYFAISSWTGLATENYYRRGLDYNDTIAAAEAQAARGWRMTFTLEPEAREQGGRFAAVQAAFTDRYGNPLEDLRVRAVLTRPTREGFDVTLPLRHAGGGVYGGRVSLPLPGQWDARIVAAGGHGRSFQQSRRVFVP